MLQNARTVIATAIATAAVAIPAIVYIPDAVSMDVQSPREFTGQFLDDLNALNFGKVCEQLAVASRGQASVADCALNEAIGAGFNFLSFGAKPVQFEVRPEAWGKTVQGKNNVYSVPVQEPGNPETNGYADIQKDQNGEWKLLSLRRP